MKRFVHIAIAGFASLALPLGAQAQSGGTSDFGKSGTSVTDQTPRDQATSGNTAQDQIDPNQDKSVKPRGSIGDSQALPPAAMSDDVLPAPRSNAKGDSVGLPKSGVRHSYGRRSRSSVRRTAPPSTLDTGSGGSNSGSMNNTGGPDTGTMDNPGSNMNGVTPTPGGIRGNATDESSPSGSSFDKRP